MRGNLSLVEALIVALMLAFAIGGMGAIWKVGERDRERTRAARDGAARCIADCAPNAASFDPVDGCWCDRALERPPRTPRAGRADAGAAR